MNTNPKKCLPSLQTLAERPASTAWNPSGPKGSRTAARPLDLLPHRVWGKNDTITLGACGRHLSMHYDFIAIPDADVPQAVEPIFQHVVTTYASEANKTASVWRAVPDDLLDFKPHERTNPIRTILAHQLLSERRFFAQFVGTDEPPVEQLLPAGEKPLVEAYIEKYVR